MLGGRSLETDRLLMRPYENGDLVSMVQLYGDPTVTAFTKLGRRSAEQTRTILAGYLEVWSTLGFGVRALFRKTELEFVGECGLFVLDSGTPALRYALLPDHWGQGLVVEAVRATLTDAFAARGLDRVVSIVQVPNAASHRVMDKAGLRPLRRDRDGDTELIVYEAARETWTSGPGS